MLVREFQIRRHRSFRSGIHEMHPQEQYRIELKWSLSDPWSWLQYLYRGSASWSLGRSTCVCSCSDTRRYSAHCSSAAKNDRWILILVVIPFCFFKAKEKWSYWHIFFTHRFVAFFILRRCSLSDARKRQQRSSSGLRGWIHCDICCRMDVPDSCHYWELPHPLEVRFNKKLNTFLHF